LRSRLGPLLSGERGNRHARRRWSFSAGCVARQIRAAVAKLSRELKALAESGLIDRKDFGTVPPKVEYRLTRKGQSFIPVVDAIRGWGARHLAGDAEELAA
jgi:DNA-binding HxlR family transcriptional regulator